MGLRLGTPPPTSPPTRRRGRSDFHEWLGDSWGVLFSHPKDFTPVCTTELGYMARITPEFEKRNVKVIGLSVDPTERHEQWADDIEETQGARPTYPIIGDSDFNVSKLYDMLPASTSGDPLQRTPADNQTVRNVFVDRPGQEGQADPRLPDDDRPQLRRGAARHRLAAAHGQPQGRHAGELEAGRGRHHLRRRHRRAGQGDLPRRVEVAEAVPAHRARSRAAEPRLAQTQFASTHARTGGASIARCAAGSLRTIVALIGTLTRSASTTTGSAPRRRASSAT